MATTPKTKPADTAAPKPADTAAVKVMTGALPADFKMPEPTRGGTTPMYPIDDLEVGGAFGVTGKTKRDMAAIVARANAKYRQTATAPGTGEKVEVIERHFYAINVDDKMAAALHGGPFEGATVLVTRDK